MNDTTNKNNFNSHTKEHNSTTLDYRTSELGTAERLIDEHKHDLLYCESMGGWWHWNGVRWRLDNNAVHGYAEQLARTLLIEAAGADRSEQDQLIAHAKHTLKDKALNAIVSRARRDTRVIVEADIFDANPHLLNVENGTVDVRTGAMHDHRREDYITKLAPVSFYTTATAPLWEQFLTQVLPDEEVRRYVQKAIGQALTGTTEQQALYVNHGSGANGKSTFFDAIFSMMGDYAGVIDTDVLMERNRPGGATPEIMFLIGKRMVIASESKQGDHLNESMIKKLTGDEYLTGRNLYAKEMVTFKRLFKLFMHVNHRPEIKGTDYAIWRRQRLIPWTITIADEAKDRQLPDKLRTELPGILNWSLAGYQLYLQEGLEPPEAVQTATDQYREDMDKVGQFIRDKCITNMPGSGIREELSVPVDELYKAYVEWCVSDGVRSEKKRKFGERMKELEYAQEVRKRTGKATRVWLGIGLLKD